MKKWGVVLFLGILIFSITALIIQQIRRVNPEYVELSKETLQDKIKGGWAGKTIGCTFGGPVEFLFQGSIVQDYVPLPWTKGLLQKSFEKSPGLYDDIYMNLTFVATMEKEGLDAPASLFAKAFARSPYPLWHANQAARYNILKGMMPPASGHWLNNPHADDIDFQIEADFAGLMCPGMVRSSAQICDRIGHIMNYGDGWYSGVYVAAMYSLAFVRNDIRHIAVQAARVIPVESGVGRLIADVLRWHKENPSDWKQTWFKVQRKWGEDLGCPEGVFHPFDIDAKINVAWVLLGLLYGNCDYGKTLSISARCGDDADCNAATAGGILGTLLGYSAIPAFWKQGLSAVESLPFSGTPLCLNDAYSLSLKHALAMVQRNNGQIQGNRVRIRLQQAPALPLEQGFAGHFPEERRQLGERLPAESVLEFSGCGFAINGETRSLDQRDHVLQVEMSIDDGPPEPISLPTAFLSRRPTLFWNYGLSDGSHRLRLKLLNPGEQADVYLRDMVVYVSRPVLPRF